MFDVRAPAVYFGRTRLREQPITGLRSDIAGFVGIAARGPLHQAVRIPSWKDFLLVFGNLIPQAYLGYGVRGFFENGGRDCYVVRIANPQDAAPASLRVYDGNRPLFNLEATSPGVWGRAVEVAVRRASNNSVNLYLSVLDGTNRLEMFRGVPLTDDLDEVNRVLNPNRIEDPDSNEVSPPPNPYLVKAVELNFDGSELRIPRHNGGVSACLGGGSDGLERLEISHYTGEGAPPNTVWGLNVLELVDDVSILAIPDGVAVPRDALPPPRPPREPDCCEDEDELAMSDTINLDTEREYPPLLSEDDTFMIQQALIVQCERLKDRVAILDIHNGNLTPEQILKWRNNLPVPSKYAAVYYPWLRVLAQDSGLRNVPPSGWVAGIYARLDVHRAPANEIVEAAQDVTFVVDGVTHGFLNQQAINVFRAQPGRGLRVMGARTLSDDTRWRFMNVRRLFIFIEESIDQSTQWMVFEPNDQRMWYDITRVVSSFLNEQWRRGRLDGATPELAYDVKCDAETNPPSETDQGRVICQIGVQPPFPAEFVTVRIGKTSTGTEVIEEG